MLHRKLPIIVLVAAVLVTGTAARSGAEDLSRRDRMLRLLNQVRRHHGLPIFRINRDLSTYAWHHSRRMARQDRIFHTTDLYRQVRAYRPSTWGENVGEAARMRMAMRLFMHSAAHRENILKRAFRYVGVGVVRARGCVWITTIFYGG